MSLHMCSCPSSEDTIAAEGAAYPVRVLGILAVALQLVGGYVLHTLVAVAAVGAPFENHPGAIVRLGQEWVSFMIIR